jgi:hypothetical protein
VAPQRRGQTERATVTAVTVHAVKHDLGALELRADDERRQQTAERRRRTASSARGQCAFRPASSAGSWPGLRISGTQAPSPHKHDCAGDRGQPDHEAGCANAMRVETMVHDACTHPRRWDTSPKLPMPGGMRRRPAEAGPFAIPALGRLRTERVDRLAGVHRRLALALVVRDSDRDATGACAAFAVRALERDPVDTAVTGAAAFGAHEHII